MTDRKDLEYLQDKARRAGRVCNFFIGEDGYIDGIFYLDAHGPGRQKSGLILDPISFAERERAKPLWYEMLGANARRKLGDLAARKVKGKRSTV